MISVYGRSGSGKSSVVRNVCESFEEILYCIVNLRMVNTIFGSSNLILEKLDRPRLKSAHGINIAMSVIEEAIVSKLNKENKKFFVLVLDEFDGLFFNRKEKPSDFIYKLLIIQERLREKGFLMTIICISNNALAQYDLDDRIKSRIGSFDVFFEPYSKEYVLEILGDRIKKALSDTMDQSVLDYCSEVSSVDYGDARRAIDLMRTSVEIAAKKKEKVSKLHVDSALLELYNGRIVKMVKNASPQFRMVCFCLARLSYLTDEEWHPTSDIYHQYKKNFSKLPKLLGYRRISEFLVEITNTGIAQSQTASRGRGGYGTSYKLTMPPEILGRLIQKEFWKEIEENKTKHLEMAEKNAKRKIPQDYYSAEKFSEQKGWKDYVGV